MNPRLLLLLGLSSVTSSVTESSCFLTRNAWENVRTIGRHHRLVVPLPLTSTDESDAVRDFTTTALLRVSYDGRGFTGWSCSLPSPPVGPLKCHDRPHLVGKRKKKNLPPGYIRSVQGDLQRCLSKLHGNAPFDMVVVEGCSRTDKGVHATGMVAQIYCYKNADRQHHQPQNGTDPDFQPLPMSLSKLMYTLNRMLPSDIRVLDVAPVPFWSGNRLFHPSVSSVSKTYTYQISTGIIQDPLERRYAWHVPYTDGLLDGPAMQLACEALEGQHNFAAFQGAPRGSEERHPNTLCCLSSVSVSCTRGNFNDEKFVIRVTGDRFVYKMVRFLVGAIVAVGCGKLTVQGITDALETGVRTKQWQCAPPHGLTLVNILYEVDIHWQHQESMAPD